MKTIKALFAVAASFALASGAQADTFEVFAKGNSVSGGTGLSTGLVFDMGQAISGSVDVDDLWSAGALPRWSNADGLIQDIYATGTDESGQAPGTHIGKNWANDFSKDGYTFDYGTLVGKINDSYFKLGTSFNIVAPDAGELKLYYWDSNNGDNVGSVFANITAPVPEPSTYALMLGGLGLVGFMAARRKRALIKYR